MADGLQIQNLVGRMQIDQDYANARLIAQGSCSPAMGGVQVTMPYDFRTECPLVFMRPSQPEMYVGGMYSRTVLDDPSVGANGAINMRGQCPWDYAIFAATKGAPVTDASAFGLEVYRSDGSVAYSSRHIHACLRHLFAKPADSSTGSISGGWPNSYSLSGYSSMPWLLANPLLMTWAGVGDASESMGAIMAKVNSSFTTVTVDMRDGAYDWIGGSPANWYRTFPTLANRQAYNPYYGRPAWFGVGHFA